MKNIETEVGIVDVRRFVFEIMQALKAGEVTVHEASTQAKLAHQIMDGYKTQVRLLEVVGLDSLKPKDVKQLTQSMDK